MTLTLNRLNPKHNKAYRYATVCSSNINRSISSHLLLMNEHMDVRSFGTGREVRLPGRTAFEPKTFQFGVAYEEMWESLTEDASLYGSTTSQIEGVIELAKRARGVKYGPERWQSLRTKEQCAFDVVVAFEERIFDHVVEDLSSRDPTGEGRLVVVCIDTKDNPEEGRKAGLVALKMCLLLEELAALDGKEREAARSARGGAADDDDEDEVDMLIERIGEVVDVVSREREREGSGVKCLFQVCFL